MPAPLVEYEDDVSLDQVGPGGFVMPDMTPPASSRTLKVTLPKYPVGGGFGPNATLVITSKSKGYDGELQVTVEGEVQCVEEYNALIQLITHLT